MDSENQDTVDYDPEDDYENTEIIVDSHANNEDINLIYKLIKQNKKNYVTQPSLTKYEKTRILSERCSQIESGSKVFLTDTKLTNAYDIAATEFNEKKIPFILKRPIGNGYEYWKIKDLY